MSDAQCECCCGDDGSEGKEWFIGAEGEDICARCAAELLGAERDAMRQALREIAALGRTDGPAAPLLVKAGDIAAAALPND